MMKTLIKNGKVCLKNKIEVCDLLIADGKISSIGADNPEAEKIIDAKGHYVLPGFMDIHTHVHDKIGGYDLADTYQSATKIAILNGITTIYNFITQPPDETLLAAIQKADHKSKGNTFCNVGWHLTPTQFNESAWEEINDCISKGFKSFKFYTTYKEAGLYSSYEQIKLIANRVKEKDVTILVHCEDEHILQINASNIDRANPYSHTLMRPPSAEWVAIEKVLQIAKETGVKFHIVHVSTTKGVELIHSYKLNSAITYETAPHYLLLNEKKLQEETGYYYLCSPPLRSEKNRSELYQQAQDGLIDVYATDHCPFLKRDKDVNKENIQKTPKGIAGLGALVPLIFQLYKGKGDAGISELSQRLSKNPAKVVGLYPRKGIIKVGADADLVILKDSDQKKEVVSSFSDTYQPYHDFYSTLQIKSVFLEGKLVVENDKIVEPNRPLGKICLN